MTFIIGLDASSKFSSRKTIAKIKFIAHCCTRHGDEVKYTYDMASEHAHYSRAHPLLHRLQLSRNLLDGSGFLAAVPGTGRLYYNCIVGPGWGPDTSINTSTLLQLMNCWWYNEQAACGSVLQTVVFALKALQVVYLAHALKIHFLHTNHQIQLLRVWCGWSFN